MGYCDGKPKNIYFRDIKRDLLRNYILCLIYIVKLVYSSRFGLLFFFLLLALQCHGEQISLVISGTRHELWVKKLSVPWCQTLEFIRDSKWEESWLMAQWLIASSYSDQMVAQWLSLQHHHKAIVMVTWWEVTCLQIMAAHLRLTTITITQVGESLQRAAV